MKWCWCSPGPSWRCTLWRNGNSSCPFLGAITLPIAALALILMQVLPGEIRPLVPALQSTWLQIHVTLAMLSYAGFTISFAVALLYLIKDGVTTRNFLSWCAALVVGVYGTIAATSINGSMALTMAAWDPATREKVMLAPHKALMVPLESLGWPFVIALALAAATLALNLAATYSSLPGKLGKDGALDLSRRRSAPRRWPWRCCW